MTAPIKVISLCISLLVFSCLSKNRKSVNANSNEQNIDKNASMKQKKADDIPKKKSFLDSVLAGSDFTWGQMRSHTLLDEKYFIRNSIFTGDTVYFRDSERPIVIIRCDDRQVCLYYYMFIFTRNGFKNTDFKMVKTGCDEEQDVSSWSLDYTIVNDSIFYLKKIYTERAEGKEDKIKVVKHLYKININGKIDSAVENVKS